MREITSIAIGFVAAAVPTPLLLTLWALLDGTPQDPVAALGLVAVFYLYTLFVALVFGGIPFVVLRSFDLVRWWVATGAGTLIGLGVVFAAGTTHIAPSAIVGFPFSGAASGLLFWAIWRKGAIRSSSEKSRVPSA